MDRETLLHYWALMGIERIDEDHRTLQAMQQTPEVAWLVDVATEAKQRFHAWETEHHPERVAAALQVP